MPVKNEEWLAWYNKQARVRGEHPIPVTTWTAMEEDEQRYSMMDMFGPKWREIITDTVVDGLVPFPPNVPIFTHDQWDQLLDQSFHRIRELATLKGAEYSGDTDRLLNFRRNAAALNLPIEVVWAVYAAKHWDAIMQYVQDIKNGKSRTRLETIDGRIDDLITYLLLFRAMGDERSEALAKSGGGEPIEAPNGATKLHRED